MDLPGVSDHHVIVGRNGSGKTVNAAWSLSERDYDARPWYILNSKGDALLNKIPGVTYLKMDELPSKKHKPGLYMYRPIAEVDDDAVNAILWEIFERQRAGLYADEGYSLPHPSSGLNAILTQGRSRKISCIILSQRPVWLSRFVWSESNFIQCFELSMDDDIKAMQKLFRFKMRELPKFHSYYKDVKTNETCVMGPCPDERHILNTFEERRTDQRRLAFL